MFQPPLLEESCKARVLSCDRDRERVGLSFSREGLRSRCHEDLRARGDEGLRSKGFDTSVSHPSTLSPCPPCTGDDPKSLERTGTSESESVAPGFTKELEESSRT